MFISVSAVMDVRDHMSDVFADNQYLYVHCFDLKVEKILHLKSLPCLEFYMVMGHISFPDKLTERRAVLFLHSDKNVSKLREQSSPAIIEVKSSCIHTVSVFAYTSLPFFNINIYQLLPLNLHISINSYFRLDRRRRTRQRLLCYAYIYIRCNGK